MKINLLDPGAYDQGQPFDQMFWLQEHDPVHWHAEPNDGPGFWALTRYADVKTVHSNPKLFSSHPTITVMDSFAPGDEDHPHLICSDPPHHTAHRRFLGEELAPAVVREQADHVQELAERVIDEVIEAGECDFVHDVAGELACFVAADLLGISRADGVALYEITDRVANAEDTTSGDGLAASQELYAYAMSVRGDRMQCPRADAVTRYAHGEVDGKPSDEMQFFLDFLMLFGGAVDTARNVLAGGMDAFFQEPRAVEPARGATRARSLGRRGDAPLGHADRLSAPYRDAGHRDRRPGDQGRPEGRVLPRRGEPRPSRLHRPAHVQHHPLTEQPPRLRLRTPLLPRRPPRPPRAQCDARADRPPDARSQAQGGNPLDAGLRG